MGGVFGVLHYKGYTCYTLEDPEHLIPLGNYNVTLRYSPKANKTVLWVHVPGRKWIEIHTGNFVEDSKGCILVGISHTDKSLVGSGAAFNRLMKLFSEPCVLSLTS